MSGGLWFDVQREHVAGRDADGNVVVLVLAGPDGPGLETPTATLWRAAGRGRGIDNLKAVWADLRRTGELLRRQLRLRVRRAQSIRELVDIALQTGDADALAQAIDEADQMAPGAVPAPIRTAARAVARLQNSALESAETLLSPFDAGITKLLKAGKVALGVYVGFKLVELIRK